MKTENTDESAQLQCDENVESQSCSASDEALPGHHVVEPLSIYCARNINSEHVTFLKLHAHVHVTFSAKIEHWAKHRHK